MFTEHLYLPSVVLFAMGRERFKNIDMLPTLMELRDLQGMDVNISHNAVCIVTD